MFSPYSFDSRVIIQELTRTYDGVGNVDTWVTKATVWCCVCQPSNNRYVDVFSEFGQRLATNTVYKLIVREKQAYDYATTRFIWKSRIGDRILKPLQSQILPGHRHTPYSTMIVEDITEMSSPV